MMCLIIFLNLFFNFSLIIWILPLSYANIRLILDGEYFYFMENYQIPLPEGRLSDIADSVNELSSMLKVIEDRQTNLRRKNQLTEQNMLNMNKKLTSDIKALSLELSETKKQLDEISEKLLQFINELKKCAKKEDVRIIEKYLEFWSPINFVTREEAERMIRENINQEL